MAGRNAGEKSDCSVMAPLLERFAAAVLGAEDERRVWEHLAECAACRARRVALADPGALFLELRDASLPDNHWEGFMERLGERLDREAPPGRRRWWSGWGTMLRYPRLAYVATPLAMVLVLGATLFVLRPGSRDLAGRLTRTEAVRSPYDRPRPRPPRLAERLTGGQPPAFALPVADLESLGPPVLEEVISPGARVYRFDVGGEADEPPIYLVVDESIEF
jgi:hypothetical protein